MSGQGREQLAQFEFHPRTCRRGRQGGGGQECRARSGRLLELDGQVREAKTRADELRRRRKEISDRFKDAAPAERPRWARESKGLPARSAPPRRCWRAAGRTRRDAAARAEHTLGRRSVGPDESANVVVRREGEVPSFDFEPLDHVELIERNDWAELARITQVRDRALIA
jgi:seryl-tRNA synthetase